MKVYGITNCDTVKKALLWLKENQIEYEFHDFKKHGIGERKLKEWANHVGWEALMNKRGTTWKKLNSETQASISTENAAFKLMMDKTSIIKRPVLENGTNLLFGFDADQYKTILKK